MSCEKWVMDKYCNFYKKHEYIPRLFHPYNEQDLKGVCSTISTSTGCFTGVGTILVATKKRSKANE